MSYTREEVLKASLEYFGGDELAAESFFKYALKDADKVFHEKSPDQMHARLAREFARIEKHFGGERAMSEEYIYSLFDRFKYVVCQGSPMMGIGNDSQHVSLSNCTVVASPQDTVSGILNTGRDMANLFKRRCGVGSDISTLRPDGSSVSNSAGTSTGAWSFADFYSYITRMIGQTNRRGATMISIDVRHPDVEKFAVMKRDLTKVTGANVSIKLTDEFMRAVKNNTTYEQKWPVGSDTPSISKYVSAQKIWDVIIESATHYAEPGLLMWDTITRFLPSHCYPEFYTVCVNPCFSGDTRIAVADGRNAVTIKQLADEGKDVPLYSVNADGRVEIKMGRNPRITGFKPLVRVHLDDKSYIDVTEDHRFPMLDGSTKEAKDLENGDSLCRFTKRAEFVSGKNSNQYYRINTDIRSQKNRIFEHKLIAKFFNPSRWESTYQENKENGWLKGGLVVHHRDFNPLNNAPDNLAIMTFRDHNSLHAKLRGPGEKNGNYSGFTNKEIEQGALELSQQMGRRFSSKEWIKFCKAKKFPMEFSEWRKKGWFNGVKELSVWAATELGYDHVDCDPRLVKTLKSMLEQGYEAHISGSIVMVKKICEHCRNSFEIEHCSREQSLCSQKCSNRAKAQDPKMSKKMTKAVRKYAKARQDKNKEQQARVYSELKFTLGRDPLYDEWSLACKKEKIPSRLYTKYGFKSYREVKEAGDQHNHKVVKVEVLNHSDNVYNITVDDNHTVGIVTSTNGGDFTGIFAHNCGELPLGAQDSCRLITQNLKSYVINPFTPQAEFDFKLLRKHTEQAMRLSDDLVQLESEKLQKLIDICDEKSEKELYQKMFNICNMGRRTGLGTHGLADALARMCLAYDSDEAIELVDKIYDCRKQAAYRESVNLAKERGPFPSWNPELEKDHPFLATLDKSIRKNMAEHGRRNVALLTCAPTGTVSILSQTSSGVEPVFRNEYIRRKKRNHNEEPNDTDFVDELGDRWREFKVRHHNVQEWIDKYGGELPEYFVESHKIDWIRRLEIQQAMQRHIDHSISSTINLPKGTKTETVAELYMKAWELGLKGVTVYVDGSRSGVLVNETAKYTDAVKRPDDLECDIHQVTVKGEKWTILVGLMGNQPYEIFAGKSKYVEIPKKYKRGRILKRGRSTMASKYDLYFGEDGVIKDIGAVFENEDFSTAGRLVSALLRHFVAPNFIVEQLTKDTNEALDGFHRVVSRVLKKYIKNGTKVYSDKTCPECQSESMIYSDGCMLCNSCGWTKCG